MTNLIPEGYYDAVAAAVTDENGKLVKARFGMSKNDNEQVLIVLKILGGDYAGTLVPWFGAFTKDAGRRTVESLRYLGLKGSKLNDINDQVLDQRVSVEIQHHEWEGKVSARVAWINKIGSGIKFSEPMTQDHLRAFSAKLQNSLKGIPEHVGPTVDPTEDPGPTPNGTPDTTAPADNFGGPDTGRDPGLDDGIPF